MSQNYYEDIYLKRLNRYGYDYQSRIQGQRERVFEDKLLKSVYRVDFEYDGEMYLATGNTNIYGLNQCTKITHLVD